MAYLQVDAGLTLVGVGGQLEAYGLAELRVGGPAVEQAFFLEGLLPPVETPYVVPSMELKSGRAADLHFFLQDDTLWVVLLDVSAERDAARRMQQKAYDMTLAQEREAQLNRQLEAANAALLATQSELKASHVPLIQAFEGTLDRFVGDGLIVYFNDPLPCPNPAERAVGLAIAMRDAVMALAQIWRRRDYQIGFGIGIAQGFATLGQIGFEGRFDYSAIGTVINTAARLCETAKDGQILVTSRIAAAVAETADVREIGPLTFKGLSRPLAVCNVEALKVT